MSKRDEIIAKIVNKNQGESEEGSRNWCQKEECASQAWDAAIEEVRRQVKNATGNWAATKIKTVEMYKILDSLTEVK